MRILVYGINYAPELTGIGKYTGEMSEWLASRGHEVRVITAPPYYPEWRVGEGYSPRSYKTEKINGVTVRRCPLYVPGRPSGKKRVAHLLSFAVSSFPAALKEAVLWRPDIVFAVEPPFLSAPGALLTARLCGAKAWLHVQDLELDAAAGLGIIKQGRAMAAALRLESAVMRRFDMVSTISPVMRHRIIAKGVRAERTALFPNWVDTGKIFPLAESRLRKELGIAGGKLVFLYSGNMGEKQGLDILIEAAEKLRADQDIIFVLCGDGAIKERLRKKADGLGNVIFMPLQPVERLNELLSAADAHLLPQRADAADLVMPSKLPGMLASGRPVIATAQEGTQLAQAIRNCGIRVSPGDAAGLAEAVRRLARDPAERTRLGLVSRARAESEWDSSRVLPAFEDALSGLVRSPVGRVSK